MPGRGTRLAPGKDNCLVLDFAGNIARHGPIDLVQPTDPPKGGAHRDMRKYCPECWALNALAARVCVNCGYEFPQETKLEPTATTLPILSTDRLEWVEVGAVSYRRHEKPGRRPSLRVDYQCGLLRHREWV